jgi:hypothetical protein
MFSFFINGYAKSAIKILLAYYVVISSEEFGKVERF